MTLSEVLKALILGVVQGVLEWLPVSSSGFLLLLSLSLYEKSNLVYDYILLLHLGTLVAVSIKFRKDIAMLFEDFLYTIMRKKRISHDLKSVILIILSTAITGVPAFIVSEKITTLSGHLVMGFLGIFLVSTGIITMLKPREKCFRERLNTCDAILLGLTQGLAAIPGLSRSGSTIAVLLLRKLKSSEALRWSYLASIPAVLGSLILVFFHRGYNAFLKPSILMATLSSFIFGYLTIDVMLRVSRKIDFSWFTLITGFLLLFSTCI
ncbi:MAG: hypothetical protein B6U94_04425 [Thermofilum sp. ex4484_79]|nr:MAG: hypothetical protein B6U94_04425 [Thermofilum sp. ex4484_79]